MQKFRAKKDTRVPSLAGAIAAVIKKEGAVEIETIGAGALNQAVKSVAKARGFIAPSGFDLTITPNFQDVSINGKEKTGVKLLIKAVSSF